METTHSGLEALERAQSKISPDLVLLDLVPGDPDSMHTLRWLQRACPMIRVILLSQPDDHQRMVEALRLGARDFLIKPFHEQELERVLKDQLANRQQNDVAAISDEIEKVNDNLVFVAASPAMKKLRAQAELLAQVTVPVLIVGERGSGKRTTAQLIHELSARSGSRFAQLSCSALTGDQLEKEIFGTENGVGATTYRPGKFEFCHRGTLLLKEVSEMPASLQIRMLRALQQQRIVRHGSETTALDVRVLATNTTEWGSAKLRRSDGGDLMTRLSAFTLHVPPLRHRLEDIPALLEHFMTRLARHHGLSSRMFSDTALEVCQHYSWPGNVQGLENFVKAYLMLGDESLLMLGTGTLRLENSSPHPDQTILNRLDNLKSNQTNDNGPLTSKPSIESASLKSLVRGVKEEAERSAIASALEQTHWNRKAAARLLQISYRALLYKIDEYQMTPPESYLAAIAAPNPVKNGRS
jgi:DNA-binding NtrC family response regulator